MEQSFKQQLYQYIQTHSPYILDYKELEQVFNKSYGNIRTTIMRLCNEGLITKSSQTVVTSVTPKNKHIITKYYVIINNNNEIVYVGMTIRTIEQRFKEHCAEKHLDPTQYKIEEIDRIEHSLIETIEDYNREKKKAVDLEQQYIKIALKNGCKLMNKTIGGEWNASYSLFKLYQTKYNKDLDKQWIERLEYWLLNPVPNIVMTKDLLDALKKQFYKGLNH